MLTTDLSGMTWRWHEQRHSTAEKAMERVNREREKHGQWRQRYEAAQAASEAEERLRVGVDDYSLGDFEAELTACLKRD
jgi:hypothetical protein